MRTVLTWITGRWELEIISFNSQIISHLQVYKRTNSPERSAFSSSFQKALLGELYCPVSKTALFSLPAELLTRLRSDDLIRGFLFSLLQEKTQ